MLSFFPGLHISLFIDDNLILNSKNYKKNVSESGLVAKVKVTSMSDTYLLKLFEAQYISFSLSELAGSLSGQDK